MSNVDVWNIILTMGFEFFILDESHKIKQFDGKRAKAAHALSRQCKYKFILTGSPVLQNALDLWSQMYVLDPEILPGNFYSFRSQYFYNINANKPWFTHPDWVPKDKLYFKKMGYKKEESLEHLSIVIAKHSYTVTTDEVIDLPQRTYTTRDVFMGKEQARLYKEMKDTLVAFINHEEASKIFTTGAEGEVASVPDVDSLPEMMRADLAIVKMLRLQQLICGIFTNVDGEVKQFLINRLKICKDLIEEITADKANKIIIWSVFKPTYEQLQNVCDDLKISYVMLTGLQSRYEKQESMDAFNNDPGTRIIIANQSAGGTGTQLQAANYEIYYSRSFKLEDDLQSNARAYRAGQKRKTTRIDLITPDTIDSRIVEVLAGKRKHAEDILAVKNNELTRAELLKMI